MAEYIAYPNIPQAQALEAFLETQGIAYERMPDVKLPKHVLEGIEKGQEDIEAARFISFEEFKKRLSSNK